MQSFTLDLSAYNLQNSVFRKCVEDFDNCCLKLQRLHAFKNKLIINFNIAKLRRWKNFSMIYIKRKINRKKSCSKVSEFYLIKNAICAQLHQYFYGMKALDTYQVI